MNERQLLLAHEAEWIDMDVSMVPFLLDISGPVGPRDS